MLGFFPDPYPDELLYSACARYADRVQYPNKQSHIFELLGSHGLSAIVDFPNRIGYLISILPPGNHYSVKQIINENTLLPFYEPFLPSDRAELMRREMRLKSKDNNLRSRAAITVKQVRMPEYLRLCPLCLKDDRKEYGETYWHRLHQLPGVLVCPSHFCFLEDSSLEWKRGIGRHFYSAGNHTSYKKPRLLKKADATQQILLKLAESAQWILSHLRILPGSDLIRDRYYNQLLKKELAYYNGRIRNNKLFKAFHGFYPNSLLEILGCSIESTYRSWIFRIVEKSKTDMIHHPIRHLLMMNFLGFSAEQFFTSFTEFKPFVEGPYPCLSRASDHYGELRIQQCEVFDNLTKGTQRGKPIAAFTCDCGFIYQRIGPDKLEDDRFRYDSIREYGISWENKLREMWNDFSLSREEIGRRMKISALSVTNAAHRLNFPMNSPGARVSNDKAHRRTPRRTLSESKTIFREKWIEVLSENPQANRTKLIKIASFEYLWLMRNDAKWIKEKLPEVLQVPRKRTYLDWEEIDNKLSAEVRDICQKILLLTPTKRVCITEVIKRTNYKSWIEKRELKLPKTAHFLSENLESLEDYMIRKLKQTEENFLKAKKIPSRSQLTRQAVIENTTTKNSKRIQEEIDKSLIKIKDQLSKGRNFI